MLIIRLRPPLIPIAIYIIFDVQVYDVNLTTRLRDVLYNQSAKLYPLPWSDGMRATHISFVFLHIHIHVPVYDMDPCISAFIH